MSNVIDEIIEIDKNARNRIADAHKTADDIKVRAEEQSEKIKQDYKERIEKRLAIVRENYSKFADEEISTITKKENEAIANLENIMNKFGEQWKNEIIDRIINPERS